MMDTANFLQQCGLFSLDSQPSKITTISGVG